jgi:hypothetical protein
MHRDYKQPVLFLDFDGVLHPDRAYLNRGRPILVGDGTLFMWADILVDLLAPHPEIQIVISSSWARELRFSRAKKYLPQSIQQKVIGATWHSAMAKHPDAEHRLRRTWWDDATRYEQIKRYVDRAKIKNWLAIDDHPTGWQPHDAEHLICTNSEIGITESIVIESLKHKFVDLCFKENAN